MVATDASAKQVAAATPDPKVAYRVAPAEAGGFDAATVDLILVAQVAQVAHWFDLDAFCAEARRVGRQGALLAVLAYDLPRITPRGMLSQSLILNVPAAKPSPS